MASRWPLSGKLPILALSEAMASDNEEDVEPGVRIHLGEGSELGAPEKGSTSFGMSSCMTASSMEPCQLHGAKMEDSFQMSDLKVTAQHFLATSLPDQQDLLFKVTLPGTLYTYEEGERVKMSCKEMTYYYGMWLRGQIIKALKERSWPICYQRLPKEATEFTTVDVSGLEEDWDADENDHAGPQPEEAPLAPELPGQEEPSEPVWEEVMGTLDHDETDLGGVITISDSSSSEGSGSVELMYEPISPATPENENKTNISACNMPEPQHAPEQKPSPEQQPIPEPFTPPLKGPLSQVKVCDINVNEDVIMHVTTAPGRFFRDRWSQAIRDQQLKYTWPLGRSKLLTRYPFTIPPTEFAPFTRKVTFPLRSNNQDTSKRERLLEQGFLYDEHDWTLWVKCHKQMYERECRTHLKDKFLIKCPTCKHAHISREACPFFEIVVHCMDHTVFQGWCLTCKVL